MDNELAKSVNDIKRMNPQEVSDMNVEVVEATRLLNETNAEMDMLSSSLRNLSEVKDEYDRKVRIVRGQLTSLAVKL